MESHTSKLKPHSTNVAVSVSYSNKFPIGKKSEKKKQKTVNTFKQSQIQVFEKIKKGNLVLKTRPKDEDKSLNTKSLLATRMII